MARYTGPKHRLARREGKNIIEKESQSLARRLTVPPGMHGVRGRRRVSEYGLQLREKQITKRTYGLMEKQFRNYYETAKKIRGKTGEILLQFLETRLDNIVYRLGFAKSRTMARQMVSHGHVLIDGKKVNIPSFRLKPGQIVSLDTKIMATPVVTNLLGAEGVIIPSWLERKAAVGRFLKVPTRDQIPTEVNEQLIVEYYSK
ncbi:MAG: 30S ribosomal protein S4 [Patescibacteria group bacterium]